MLTLHNHCKMNVNVTTKYLL